MLSFFLAMSCKFHVWNWLLVFSYYFKDYTYIMELNVMAESSRKFGFLLELSKNPGI